MSNPKGGSTSKSLVAVGYGIDVPGWWARMDVPVTDGHLLLASDGAAVLHARTGPAAIFWNPQRTASGQYTVSARFTVQRMPTFEEGYGLLPPSGAADADWMPNAALMRSDASDHLTNELAIHVGTDVVTFMANGKTIATHPVSA